jgi:hypothetical protein
MFGSSERALSFMANAITAVMFTISLAGWIDPSSIPEYSPPDISAVYLILLIYQTISSYGAASFVRYRLDNGNSIGIYIAMFSIFYCFSVSFIQGMLAVGLGYELAKEVVVNTSASAVFIYVFFGMIKYQFRMFYPKGFSITAFFTWYFRGSAWSALGLMLLHAFIVPILISMFSPHFIK